jgi:hypothetical protein
MWWLYLRASDAGFRYGDLSIHPFLVSHGRNNALPLTRAHLYELQGTHKARGPAPAAVRCAANTRLPRPYKGSELGVEGPALPPNSEPRAPSRRSEES